MIPSNNAIEVYRQRINIQNLQPQEDMTVPCMEASQTLRQCILKSNANVLDRADVESKCETREWRKSCTGEWRRRLVEGYYREVTNRQTYKQKDLDEYMRKRNNQFAEALN